jgi:hypothetical protein
MTIFCAFTKQTNIVQSNETIDSHTKCSVKGMKKGKTEVWNSVIGGSDGNESNSW